MLTSPPIKVRVRQQQGGEADGLLGQPGSDCPEWFNTTIGLNRCQYRRRQAVRRSPANPSLPQTVTER
jgi:hypothetical protein